MKFNFKQHYIFEIIIVCFCCMHLPTTSSSETSKSDTSGPLVDVLHSFERLQHVDVVHKIVKRSTEENPGHIREVKFNTLGKHFHARLKSNFDVVATDFAAYLVDSDNNKKEIRVDTEELYKGYLVDEPDSKVFAHWEGYALLAKIETKSDVYYVEPAWRFINETSSDEMITYKASDIKNSSSLNEKFCGYVSEPDELENSTEKVKRGDRLRRQSEDPETAAVRDTPPIITKNTCPLLLVADYRFFENMGQKSASRTTTYLLGLIDRVDAIYRNTDFGQGYSRFGFEVKEILIHEAPNSGEEHYNTLKDKWDTKHLLEAFSRENYSKVCLAHLFTALADKKSGMLGLSYVAKASLFKPGGLCSHKVYYKGGYPLYLNTGWSSSLNSYNRRILTQEADLVTTHEFGHNWGSEHDPDTKTCSPSGDAGGKFIMYTYSVPGYDRNNKLFSPCSRIAMQEVLASKSHKCFTEQRGAYCGNQKIEGEEECDGGAHMRSGHDTCCHSNCKLRKPYADCSDANHICCQGCKFLPTNVVCRDGSSLDAGCKASTNCSGISGDCPKAENKKDNQTCLGRGKCKDGICESLCKHNGKEPCICDNAEDSCKYCCRENETSICTPFLENSNFIPLTNGTPCVQGYCSNTGACIKQEGELIQRLWSIIENLNPSRLVAFMRANIVGTVIILSLFLWVPGSCIVWCLDRRRQKEEEDTVDWMNVHNSTLTRVPQDLSPRFPSLERAKKRTSRVCQNIQVNQAKNTLA